jgi:hypothetical protein
MSYVRSMSRKRYGRRAMQAMGDGITACPDPCDPASASNLTQAAQYQAACQACGGTVGQPGTCTSAVPADICDPCQTGASAQTTQIDGWTSDLSSNWAPTGQYKPSDVTSIVANVTTLIQSAQSAIQQGQAQAQANGSPSDSTLQSWADNLNNDSTQGASYASSAQSASSTALVSAPNLKQWVIFTMTDCSSAIQAVYLSSCNASWFASVVQAITSAASTLWGICKSVAGVVATAGQAVVNTAETGFQVARTGITIVAWVTGNPIPALAIAAGVWYLLSEKNRERVKSGAKVAGKAASRVAKYAVEVG